MGSWKISGPLRIKVDPNLSIYRVNLEYIKTNDLWGYNWLFWDPYDKQYRLFENEQQYLEYLEKMCHVKKTQEKINKIIQDDL